MVIAEFQDGLALEGMASKMTVPNYRVKRGADFRPQKCVLSYNLYQDEILGFFLAPQR